MTDKKSPLEVLSEELGRTAGRIEREARLRIDAAIADVKRIDAERELRLTTLERQAADCLREVERRLSEMEKAPPAAPAVEGRQVLPRTVSMTEAAVDLSAKVAARWPSSIPELQTEFIPIKHGDLRGGILLAWPAGEQLSRETLVWTRSGNLPEPRLRSCGLVPRLPKEAN